MNEYVADTHTLYWYLLNSPKLGANASKALEEADNGLALIYLPAIVLAELYYMNKKYGRPLDFALAVAELQRGSQFVLLPFNPADTLDFDAHAAVPEMHDRMIAGVSSRLGMPCLTCDKQIAGSGLVSTVW